MSSNPFRRELENKQQNGQAVAQSSHEEQSDSLTLTPLRAHYLKTTLVSLQLQQELSLLMQRNALAMLGPPFRGSADTQDENELLLFRHFLHKFVLTFPFFATAPADFFPNTVQVFLEKLLERNLIVLDEEQGDTSAATTVVRRFERYLCLLIGSGIHLAGQAEEVVKIRDKDRTRLATLDARRKAAASLRDDHHFEVNIASVRSVPGKGRLRSKSHDEFIVATSMGNRQCVYTARRYNDLQKLHVALRAKFPEDEIPAPPPKDRAAVTTEHGESLTRERNRLTLRAYLRSLVSTSSVADSEIMRDFLLRDPIELSASEMHDVEIRKHADALRQEQRQGFAQETAARAKEIHDHIGAFKQDLLRPGGLSELFQTIRNAPRVQDLPERYRLVIAWAKTSMASGLYSMFVGKDASSQNFAQLKYAHSMMPYFMVRSIMRISNPLSMMRSLLDLFLAQPFGQRSLLQRMVTGPIHEEVTEMRQLGSRVTARIGDAHLARKVDEFVAAPYRVQRVYLEQASDERIDIVTAILRSPLGGDLHQHQIHRVVQASRAYAELKRTRRAAVQRGEPEPEPDNDDAWLYEDLHVYLSLARHIHDKEQLIALIYDQATTGLMKEIITIFYAPLAQVYKAANIADTLSDVQTFITDLIRTVDECEALGLNDTQRMVNAFHDLVERHEQMFYGFIYQVHSKGSDLFDRLVQWIELFVSYVRDPSADQQADGLGQIDLNACLPRQAAQRAEVFSEVDRVIRDAYQRKLKRELKVQRKLAKEAVTQAADEVEAGLGSANDPVAEALSTQFGFSSMFGQVADVEAEESGSDSEASSAFSDSDSDSAESDGPEDAEHFRHRQATRRESPTMTRDDSDIDNQSHSMEAIRAMLPTFMEQVCGFGNLC
ncbi:hypothetical protein MPSI1_003705 [Malassezia psittaci]|uniref:PX domain-containing protein n=1 Tax=Malassezia psittaci TaxID=1821823 RepID=A0AAF0JG26_9BASI|nr:hypothetical protein MPSI1_003705 [Malassezia psittaci]